MATILVFPPPPAVATDTAKPRGPAEIVIFPGVRVEYHGERAELDLSRRIVPVRRTAKKSESL